MRDERNHPKKVEIKYEGVRKLTAVFLTFSIFSFCSFCFFFASVLVVGGFSIDPRIEPRRSIFYVF